MTGPTRCVSTTSTKRLSVTRLNKTALADVKKTINDFLKEVKTREA